MKNFLKRLGFYFLVFLLGFQAPKLLAIVPLLEFDPELAYFVFASIGAIVVAVVELRRSNQDVQELKLSIAKLQSSKVDVDDWVAIMGRVDYMNRLIDKMVDEWSGEDEDSGS